MQHCSKHVSFFEPEVNRAFTKVAGEKVTEEWDMDLKFHASTIYLYGPKAYIDKRKELVDSLKAFALI